MSGAKTIRLAPPAPGYALWRMVASFLKLGAAVIGVILAPLVGRVP
jgi:hypothetical protein